MNQTARTDLPIRKKRRHAVILELTQFCIYNERSSRNISRGNIKTPGTILRIQVAVWNLLLRTTMDEQLNSLV